MLSKDQQGIVRDERMNLSSCRIAFLKKAACRLAAVALLSAAMPGFAVLGDSASTVLADQARMKGALRSVDAHTYVMHQITAANGTVVREFVSPAGMVFGVAWRGQFPPDLEKLLGPYYFQAQQATTGPRTGRHPLRVETSGLVVRQSGHMRSLHGVAYIPQLVPAGVDSSVVQ